MCCVITYYLRFCALGNNVQNRDDDPQCGWGKAFFGAEAAWLGGGVLSGAVPSSRRSAVIQSRSLAFRRLKSVWVGKNLPAKYWGTEHQRCIKHYY